MMDETPHQTSAIAIEATTHVEIDGMTFAYFRPVAFAFTFRWGEIPGTRNADSPD